MKTFYYFVLLLTLIAAQTNNTNADIVKYSEKSSHGTDTIPQKSAQDEPVFNYLNVETKPEFKGGVSAWSKFLTGNLIYPVIAREKYDW